MPVPPGLSPKDADQVLRAVMDDNTNRLRVDAEVTAVLTDIEIRADTGDNIAITNQDGTNPLVIETDGSINTNTTIVGGELAIEISAADGDNIAISDGVDQLEINPDGSINVVLDPGVGTVQNYYNEISSVASGILTTIQNYTVLGSSSTLYQVGVSGDNIATYTIVLNSNIIMKKRTYFSGELNEDFDFGIGLPLTTGDNLEIQVIHNRPTTGDFNSRILIAEV